MAGETSVKELLTRLLDVRTSSIVIGEVVNDDPLEIKAENDPRLLITESNCFVPMGLTNHKVTISIPGVGTEKCMIKGALSKGDQVYMLSVERGALYFLLDKVV